MEIIHTNNQALNNSLVVVSAKEHGKIYQITDGEMKLVEYVEEHPDTFSDNEGFFFRSARGTQLGSGGPKEEDKAHNIQEYVKAIGSELSAAIAKLKPEKLYLFEPEYLKGLVAEHLTKPNKLQIEVVKYGNFVEAAPAEILKLLSEAQDTAIDPADPASVAGEKNAEEKRKILETGELLDNQ